MKVLIKYPISSISEIEEITKKLTELERSNDFVIEIEFEKNDKVSISRNGTCDIQDYAAEIIGVETTPGEIGYKQAEAISLGRPDFKYASVSIDPKSFFKLITEETEDEFISNVLECVEVNDMTIHNVKVAMEKVYEYMERNATVQKDYSVVE